MSSLDTLDNQAPVLVAIVPQMRDLALVRSEGWYRIPLARAPRGAGAAALAFYQPAAFGPERWCVRWAAVVQAVQVVLRRDLLADEPQHPRANDRYLRFALGPLEALPVPIPSRKLRRVAFIATTYSCLLHARDVSELWQAERERGDAVWAAGLAGRSLH